jgi:hypothetical protein
MPAVEAPEPAGDDGIRLRRVAWPQRRPNSPSATSRPNGPLASSSARIPAGIGRLLRRPGVCGAVHPVSQIAQCIGQRPHGGDRFAANLGNHGIIDVGDGMAQFHLDQFNCLLNAAAHTAGAGCRTGRRIRAHIDTFFQACNSLPLATACRLQQLAFSLGDPYRGVNAPKARGAASVNIPRRRGARGDLRYLEAQVLHFGCSHVECRRPVA